MDGAAPARPSRPYSRHLVSIGLWGEEGRGAGLAGGGREGRRWTGRAAGRGSRRTMRRGGGRPGRAHEGPRAPAPSGPSTAPPERHRDPTAAPPTPGQAVVLGGRAEPSSRGWSAGHAFSRDAGIPRDTARLTGMASIGNTCAGRGATVPKGCAEPRAPNQGRCGALGLALPGAGAALSGCAIASSHPDKTGLPTHADFDLRMGIGQK